MARVTWIGGTNGVALLSKGVVRRAGEDPLPAAVLIKGGRITGIVPMEDVTKWNAKGFKVWNLGGVYLIPALIDCHVHLSLKRNALPEKDLREALELGIGAVRDCGDAGGRTLRDLRQMNGSGVSVSTCGWAIRPPGGYGPFLGREVRDLGEFRELVLDLKTRGAQFIKILLTGAVDFSLGGVLGGPGFQAEELKVMVGLAKAMDMMVGVHANGDEGVRMALAAGVDAVEHGYLVGADTVRMMSQTQTIWVPTMVPVWRLIQRMGTQREGAVFHVERALKIYRCHEENVAMAHEMGVMIAAGTDAGAPYIPLGEALFEELKLLNRAGLGPKDSLRAGTIAGALFFADPSKPSLGAIEEGMKAHFLGVEDPLSPLNPQAVKVVVVGRP